MITEQNVFFVQDDIKKIIYKHLFNVETKPQNSMVPYDRVNYKKLVAEIMNNTTVVHERESDSKINPEKMYLEEAKYFENHK